MEMTLKIPLALNPTSGTVLTRWWSASGGLFRQPGDSDIIPNHILWLGETAGKRSAAANSKRCQNG